MVHAHGHDEPGAALHLPGAPARLRALHHQPAGRRDLPGRAAPLLDDDEPVDRRAGNRHPSPACAVDAGAACEAVVTHAAEGREAVGGGGRPRCGAQGGKASGAPSQAKEEAGAAVTELRVETEGETVGEAKWAALRELEKLSPGIDKATVRFQVVSEGQRGILGVGYSPARVVATVEANGEQPAAALVRDLIARTTDAIGISCRVEISETDGTLVATCFGRDLGLLIGRHGQTIDAIQYLCNAILARQGAGVAVVVDAAGYRARREATLGSLATNAAEQALRSGERVELEPMTAVERKIVHVSLQDFAGVDTTSEGTEPNRFVVVVPAGAD